MQFLFLQLQYALLVASVLIIWCVSVFQSPKLWIVTILSSKSRWTVLRCWLPENSLGVVGLFLHTSKHSSSTEHYRVIRSRVCVQFCQPSSRVIWLNVWELLKNLFHKMLSLVPACVPIVIRKVDVLRLCVWLSRLFGFLQLLRLMVLLTQTVYRHTRLTLFDSGSNVSESASIRDCLSVCANIIYYSKK